MTGQKIDVYGISYSLPEILILHKTPLFVSEFGARSCYNSFDKSDSKGIQNLNDAIKHSGDVHNSMIQAEEEVDENGSPLLHKLSHVMFHSSVLEHVSINFLVKNTSRGVLQELARHRIASFSVQSTRYTMSDIINIFLVVQKFYKQDPVNEFVRRIHKLNIFVFDQTDAESISTEARSIYEKLLSQYIRIGKDKFYSLSIAKSNIDEFEKATDAEKGLEILNSKAKRNVGDPFKHIITDNFSVDLVLTMNLRSLKNFFNLRLGGAAWWQIRLLAWAMYKNISENYLDLITTDAQKETFKSVNKKVLSGDWEN